MGLGKTYSTKYLLDSNNNSGVAGQVLSTTSTGIDWADANTLPGAGLWLESGNNIYNSNSGNVGIGTTLPGRKLTIGNANGFVNNQLSLLDGGGTEQATISVETTVANDLLIASKANLRIFTGSTIGSTTTLPTNERVRVTSAGNVGIGVTDPSKQLVVRGSAPWIRLEEDSASNKRLDLWVDPTSAIGYIGANQSAQQLSFQTANSDRIRILNNGNVGIGTTSPSTKTEIKQTNNDIYQLTLYNNHLSTTSKSRIGNWNSDIKISSNYMQSGGTKTQDDTAKASWVQTMGAEADSFDVSRSPAGSTTLSSLMRIEANGNVGIGTTSPGYKLDVEGDIRAKENIRVFGNSVSPPTYNAPTETSVNLGTYINDYAYIDLASTNAGGSWLDFSKGDGTDYAGRIRYVNSSDQFQISTAGSQKMVIESGGDVGIGTTNPGAKLDVNGAANIKGTANFAPVLTLGTAGAINAVINSADEMFFNIDSDNNQTSAAFWFGHNSTQGDTASNLMVIKDSGNVGIGTTNPGFKLEVDTNGVHDGIKIRGANAPGLTLQDDSSASLSTILIQSTAAAQGNLRIAADTNNVATGATIELQVSGSERMRISNAGAIKFNNYGAGTLVTDASGNITASSGGGAGGPYLPLSAGTSYPLTDNLFIRGDDKGLVVQNAASTTNVTVGAVSSSAVSTGLITLRHLGATKIVLNANDNSYFTGNVGIGVTGPNDKLDVRGSAVFRGASNGVTIAPSATGADMYFYEGNNPKIYLQSAGPSAFLMDVGIGEANPQRQLHVNSGTTNVVARFESTDTIAAIEFKDNNGSAEIGNTGDNLVFFPAGAEKMRIEAGGNVGIGVTGPSAKLEVVASAAGFATKITNNFDDSQGLLVRTSDNDSDEYILDLQSSSSATGTDYTTKFNVTKAGGVGIGTTIPTYQLDVVSAGNALLSLTGVDKPVMRFMVGTSTAGTIQAQANNSMNVSAYGTSSLNLQTVGTTPRLTILTGGNVGIGTDSPAKKLHVKESTTATYAAYIENSIAGGDYLAMIGDAGDNVFEFDSGGTGGEAQMKMYSDGVLKNLLDANGSSYFTGNVGIGTTSPGSLLEIEGATNSSTSNLLRLSRASQGSAPEKVAGFYSGTSGERGYITVSNFATAYNTSSDYRLKENIKPIEDSVERLMSLKPCNFNFISEEEDKIVMDGFIAHEAKGVVPEAVTGIKDAVDEKGNPMYQGIDQSKIVPLLTAALQQALQRIEILEQKINN